MVTDRKPASPFISIVLPVYRNADTLEELYRRLRKALEEEGLAFEVLFVDDASPDHSLRIVQSIAREDPRVVPVVLKENVGQQMAVIAGLALTRGDWAVVMDADLQDMPEAVPGLLSKGRDGFDAVFAERNGVYEAGFKRWSSRLFKGALSLLYGINPNCGTFVALHRSLIDRLLDMRGPYPYLVAMVHYAGRSLASVPVLRMKRPAGRSAYSTRKRMQSAWRAASWIAARKWEDLTRPIQPTGSLLPADDAIYRARVGRIRRTA